MFPPASSHCFLQMVLVTSGGGDRDVGIKRCPEEFSCKQTKVHQNALFVFLTKVLPHETFAKSIKKEKCKSCIVHVLELDTALPLRPAANFPSSHSCYYNKQKNPLQPKEAFSPQTTTIKETSVKLFTEHLELQRSSIKTLCRMQTQTRKWGNFFWGIQSGIQFQ